MSLMKMNLEETLNPVIKGLKKIMVMSEDETLLRKIEVILNRVDSYVVSGNIDKLYDNFKVIEEVLSSQTYYKERYINQDEELIYKEIVLSISLLVKYIRNNEMDKEVEEVENKKSIPNIEYDQNEKVDFFK